MPANIEIQIIHDVPQSIGLELQYIGGDVAVQLVDDAAPSIQVEFANMGSPGLSAYQIAVENGFVGTKSEWLDSIVGTIDGGVIF